MICEICRRRVGGHYRKDGDDTQMEYRKTALLESELAELSVNGFQRAVEEIMYLRVALVRAALSERPPVATPEPPSGKT